MVGIFFEDSRIAEITKFYSDSETSISDFNLASELIFGSNLDCDKLTKEGIIFADRIYEEAKKLERYDNSNKITDRVVHLHKRYDLLRTLLWNKLIENKEKCNSTTNTIVYFYDYLTTDFDQISTQNTMANYLTKVKRENFDKVILLPIAGDTGILSTEILEEVYGITNRPAILVNEKHKIDRLEDLNSLESLLN